MAESLGKCFVCGGHATTVYPLLPNLPAFCGEHHNPRDAGPFGCDFTGPDDFDIPDDVVDFCPPYNTRENFLWRDKGGHKWPLHEISDLHLQNIVNFLKRKVETPLPFEDVPIMGMSNIECARAIWRLLIRFLEKEQKYRKEHGIAVEVHSGRAK